MTTLLCRAFRAEPLLDGRIQLAIEDATPVGPDQIDPSSTRVLYVNDIAKKLRITPRTARAWSRRQRNPLPLREGGSILECDLFRFASARRCL